MTDHTPTPEAVYRWAKSVASSGTGDAALIEIDIITPTGTEPVVIPLTQAGELYDMLSGVLAEHNAPKPHPEGCPGCETCDLATQLADERAAHEEHRTAVSGALGLGTGAPWDAITDRARQVTADLDAARVGDAPWIRAYREDLTAANKRAERAEAAIARVRDAVVQWRGWNPTENAWAIRDIERALSGDPDPRPQDPAALDGEQPDAGPERCFVCGAPAVINQVVDRRYLCGDCFLCRCGESPCVRTGVNDPAVSAEPEKPCFHPSWDTEPTVGARRCTDCGEWLDPQPTPVELDGAALWAAIRDHAFNDTQWWSCTVAMCTTKAALAVARLINQERQ